MSAYTSISYIKNKNIHNTQNNYSYWYRYIRLSLDGQVTFTKIKMIEESNHDAIIETCQQTYILTTYLKILPIPSVHKADTTVFLGHPVAMWSFLLWPIWLPKK